MTAREFFKELCAGSFPPEKTCDTLKAGDETKTVNKIAFTMFATVDVIREAATWGADLLITHEPTYYHHYDDNVTMPIALEKQKLIEETGLVIYRYHDCMHFRAVDQITDGMLKELHIAGEFVRTPHAASYLFTPDEPISAYEVACRAEKTLGIPHVRIAGDRHHKAKTIAACFGTPGGVFELLRDESVDMVLTGEACEWALAEYARDAAALGIPKALVVMGHIGSEKGGMRYLAKRIASEYPNLEARYFECGEVYTYTDTE
jgi:putative NIF3 family GTP cyclohydrolase 1 type 2